MPQTQVVQRVQASEYDKERLGGRWAATSALTKSKSKMSEPVRLGDILPEVLRDIERRCERNPNNLDFKPERAEHRHRVLAVDRLIGDLNYGHSN
jgi:hypothetical protein